MHSYGMHKYISGNGFVRGYREGAKRVASCAAHCSASPARWFIATTRSSSFFQNHLASYIIRNSPWLFLRIAIAKLYRSTCQVVYIDFRNISREHMHSCVVRMNASVGPDGLLNAQINKISSKLPVAC